MKRSERRERLNLLRRLSPLEKAVELNDIAYIERYFAVRNTPHTPDGNPLHRAARQGKAGIAELLIAHGVDPNGLLTYGETPLHAAASEDHPSIVDALLRAGAQHSPRDVSGWTPLHLAYELESTKLLVEAGADLDARDRHGWTPLHYYARICGYGLGEDRLAQLEYLVARGADIHGRLSDGSTLLHVVIESLLEDRLGECDANALSFARLLIERGIDFRARRADGATALDLCRDDETRAELERHQLSALLDSMEDPPVGDGGAGLAL